jgi:predicted adenylyl cyclase CyaB
MHEVELKSVVDDFDGRQARVRAAGARRVFAGRLEDRRYDTPEHALNERDHVLRLRRQWGSGRSGAWLDWKGPTQYETGYKVREEISMPVPDPEVVALLLERLGYVVTREIDRDVVIYSLHGATVRFERYPKMDDLVEVEGSPDAIERAIAGLGIDRDSFTADRLFAFARRFEERTQTRAALCERELSGDYRYEMAEA